MTNTHSKWSHYVIGQPDPESRRLEVRFAIAGKLVSWSIPTYPSLETGDKYLALRELDTPLLEQESIDEDRLRESMGHGFVWDAGGVQNLADQPLEDDLAEGHLRIRLAGHRLHGAFALDRTRSSMSQEQWLLIKKSDQGRSSRSDSHRGAPLPMSETDAGRG